MDEERLEGIPLTLRAIDLTIAEVEARAGDDREEHLEMLRDIRELWREEAEKSGG